MLKDTDVDQNDIMRTSGWTIAGEFLRKVHIIILKFYIFIEKT